jgi:hypothetical protein
MTNADFIKTLSVEQIAKLFVKIWIVGKGYDESDWKEFLNSPYSKEQWLHLLYLK